MIQFKCKSSKYFHHLNSPNNMIRRCHSLTVLHIHICSPADQATVKWASELGARKETEDMGQAIWISKTMNMDTGHLF